MTQLARAGEHSASEAAAAERCPLCGGNRRKLFVRAKERTIVECPDCNLKALNPMPTLTDMEELNEETVHPFFNAALEDEESYRVYFSHKLKDLGTYTRSGRLLDVGCGAGFFLDAARKQGYQVSGVDLSPVPAAYARDSLGLDVTVGSLYEYRARGASFDAITIFQTIEHDPHTADLSAELFRILKPGGVLMVTTPAADGFIARAMGRRWFGYRNVEHVTFFSRKSLRRALEQAGFEIVFVEIEHGKRLTAKYVYNRLVNYYYNHNVVVRTGLQLFRPLVYLAGILPLFEPWAHLYAVARKPAGPRGDTPA